MISFTLALSFLLSLVPYPGSEQECVRFLQRGGCAGALHAPLGEPVEQQQQETPGAHGTYTHQDELPQAGPVTPHLLHMQTLAFTCLAVLNWVEHTGWS